MGQQHTFSWTVFGQYYEAATKQCGHMCLQKGNNVEWMQ